MINVIRALLVSFILGATHLAFAQQCIGVFPSAASSFDSNGSIQFGSGAQLINSGTIIDAMTITSSQQNANTCVSGPCIASGQASEGLSLPDFEASSSNTNITINNDRSQSVNTGDYGNIVLRDRATITFSGSDVTRISRLEAGNDSEIRLTSGNYFIDSLTLRDRTNIVVQNGGNVSLFVNALTTGNDVDFNTSGASSGQLFLGLYSNVTFRDRTEFNGLIFSEGNVEFGNDSSINGAVNASSLNLRDRARITFDESQVNALENTGLCGDDTASVLFYMITHPSTGLTCESSKVTITACADSSCNLFPEEVTVSVPQTNSSNQEISFVGQTTIDVSSTLPLPLVLTATGQVGISAATQATQCSDPNCELTFRNAGFVFVDRFNGLSTSLPDILAESSLNRLGIRAVEDDEGVCVGALTGQQNVTLSYDCVTTGAPYSTNVCRVPFANVPVNNATGESSGVVSLNFDSNGVASLEGTYNDAGRLAISASGDYPDFSIDTGGSSLFDSIPAGLVISENTSSPHIAGVPFTISIHALGDVGNSPLPSYSSSDLQYTYERLAPSSSSITQSLEAELTLDSDSDLRSALSPSFVSVPGSTPFSNGVYSSNSAENNEVGSYRLTVRDSAYLGNVLTSSSVTLGRFIPAYFDVTSNTPIVEPNCSDEFSYIGLASRFDASAQPEYLVTAMNANRQVTNLYADTEWRLSPQVPQLTNGLSLEDNSVFEFDVIADVSSASILLDNIDVFDGIGEVLLEDVEVTYEKVDVPDSSLAPFDTDISIVLAASVLIDEDDVCYRPDYIDENNTGSCSEFRIENVGDAEQRYGRLNLINTFGPETRSLRVNLQAEFFRSGNWLLNVDDTCTAIDFEQTNNELRVADESQGVEADISGQYNSISSTGNLSGGQSGISDLVFAAPSSGERGSVRLFLVPLVNTVTWPDYLNFDWNDDGVIDDNDEPSALVSFGLFRGNDRIFHTREVTSED
ncbi:hypothetical protein J3L16_09095 [Alteromonas sp. 5E99-2]|uniref:DUF6701 domain-containing protein n=1 Tax=Alteromonas sp. 5E99-2 TaxID=2817683 RepID=UPI001A99C746|nr:DUF6701 domain-containing protein [Alteromonas sp. 5E99-2]MBO1255837.1 hypothetical protein [Alteromonas sp. 5E99-2]